MEKHGIGAGIIQMPSDAIQNPDGTWMQLMSEIVAQAYSEGGAGQSGGGRVPDYTSVSYRMEIEKCLSLLIDCLGKCERILTTPVPRGYR